MATNKADEDEDLLKLASPIGKRSFARMVSWEFSKPVEPKRRRRKSGRKQKKEFCENEKEDDDMKIEHDDDDYVDGCFSSDDYFTAEEDICSSSDDEALSLDKLSLQGAAIELPKQERKAGRSKKQKRRRKKIYRQTELDFFSPFMDDESTDVVIVEDLNPVRDVPTLMEICLKTCRKEKNQQIPVLHQQKVILKCRQTLHSCQLKWLHRELARSETFVNGDSVMDGRSIFEAGSNSDEAALRDILPNLACKSYMIRTIHSRHPLCTIGQVIAALAHTVDIMLPSSFKYRHTSKDEVLDEDACIQYSVDKVKLALKARYPALIDKLFDVALCYVWWARGQIPQAAKALFEAKVTTAKEPEVSQCLQKAIFLNDCGLVYVMFGDAFAAGRCYREAADVGSNLTLHSQNAQFMQSLILSAFAWSQGLLNKSAAVNSCDAWNAALSSQKDCPYRVVQAAVEAFLCFHAGHSTGPFLSKDEETQAWLEEAEKKINDMVKIHSKLAVHHAFVLAMLGREGESLQALRNYTYYGTFDHTNGFPARQIRHSTRKSPLNPLIEVARQTNKPVPVLSMLWRRQYIHPMLTTDNVPPVADNVGTHLNLRITDDGYITGDMSMNLPPMRALLLDPYDGSVCIPHTPSVSESWFSLVESTMQKFLLPVPQQIYSDPTQKIVVDLIQVNRCEQSHGTSQVRILQWRSPGKFYQLNLGSAIRKTAKKIILEEAKKQHQIKEIKDYEMKTKKLEEHYERGWQFSYYHNFTIGLCKCGEKKLKGRRSPVDLYNARVKNIIRFGKATILLLIQTYLPSPDKCDTLVFIDCSSFDTFLNPVIHYGHDKNYHFKNSTVPISNCSQPRHHETKLIAIVQDNSPDMAVFDERGRNIKNIGLKVPTTMDFIHGFRSKFYTLNSNGNESDPDSLIEFVIKSESAECSKDWKPVTLFQPKQFVAGHNTFFIRTKTSLVVLDADTLLPLEVTFNKINVDNSSQSTSVWLDKELYHIDVLASRIITRSGPTGDDVEFYRLIFAADDQVFLLDRPCINSGDNPAPLNVTAEVEIPGRAVEACYISEQAGFVVAVTLNDNSDNLHQDHLIWYSTSGELCGVLPFLGNGPHHLYSVYLPGKQNEDNAEGWYLYFTDGHGGLCCCKLF